MRSNCLPASIMCFLAAMTACRSHSVRPRLLSSLSTTTLSIPRVVVPRTRQSKSFRDGNPLVFAGAISYTQSEHNQVGIGSLVVVEVQTARPERKPTLSRHRRDKASETKYPHYRLNEAPDEQTQFLGVGVYNPHSMYRVRILCHSVMHPMLMKAIRTCHDETEAVGIIVEHRVASAMQTRLAMNLPNPDTDTYRLVNGEGDGLSGLAIDVLGEHVAVVMSSAAWCEIHRDVIMDRLQSSLSKHPVYSEKSLDIIWRTTPGRLKQDGLQEPIRGDETAVDAAPASEEVCVSTELGIRYQTFPYKQGQKTGMYCDQRENRWELAKLCRDKRVLDLCCYHGGFSLNALVHGHAASCTGVDSSHDAIDTATENIKLNQIKEGIEFVRADISDFMKQELEAGVEYDVIVLDPPKLAPSASGLERASRKYHSLNRDALRLVSVDKGGLLLTCTCSAAMTQKDGGQYFLSMVHQASLAAGRQITLLRVSGAASCHTQSPASFPAGAYLTAALFHVSPI